MTPREQRVVRELVRAKVKRLVDRRLGEQRRMPLHVSPEARRIIRAHSHCGLSRDRLNLGRLRRIEILHGMPICFRHHQPGVRSGSLP